MRVIPFILSSILTIALIFLLNTKWGAIPPMGKFLSPQQGFWQNAEVIDAARNENIAVPGVRGDVSVYLDERLLPHVFAR